MYSRYLEGFKKNLIDIDMLVFFQLQNCQVLCPAASIFTEWLAFCDNDVINTCPINIILPDAPDLNCSLSLDV